MSHSSGNDRGDIVSVGPEAAAVLAALHSECFSEQERWNVEAFNQLLRMRGTIGWIAKDADEPVGLLVVRGVAGEYEVLTLGVRPSFQGCGIGRRLMAMLMTVVRSQRATVFLEVKMNNTVAFHLYSSLGFTQVGCREKYYPDGASARVLSFSEL